MFYSQRLLSMKGSLGAIWVAAYFYKKLKKSQVTQLDISSSIDQILEDKLVTYRVLAHLLIGVVRIYSKKVEYLFNDCNKVLLGIKDFMVRHKKDATLMETVCAPYFSITLPKSFELDAFDLEIADDTYEYNVRPLEEITPKDITLNTGEKHRSFEKDDMKDVATCWGPYSSSYSINEDVLAFHLSDFDVEVGTTSNWENNHQTFSMAEEEPPETSCKPVDNCQMFSKAEVGPPDTVKKSTQDCPTGEHSKVSQSVFHADESCRQETYAIPNAVDSSMDYHQVDMEMLQDPNLGEEGMEKVIHKNWIRGDSKVRGRVVEEDNQLDSEARVQKLLDDGSFQTLDKEMPRAVNDPRQAFDEGHSQSDLARLRDDGSSRPGGSEIPCAVEEPPQASDEGHKGDDENLKSSGNTVSLTAKGQVVTEDNLAASVRVDVNLGSNFLDMSGATTLDLLATPAAKEPARVSRKRKCVFDDNTVFPNWVLKQHIADSSDLVCKRGDCPITALAIWKADRVSNIQTSFLDPLIPCSSEIRSFFSMMKLKLPKSIETREHVDEVPLESLSAREKFENNSESASTLGKSHERLLEGSKLLESSHVPMSIEIVEPPSRLDIPGGLLEEQALAPVTPTHPKLSLRVSESPEMPEISISREIMPEIQGVEKRQSLGEDQLADFNLVNEEVSSSDAGIQDRSGWSERTSAVMRCMERIYQEKKKRREKEVVHLQQLLDRRTRKESARFFYEILVLETKGYVHATQEDAYSSILVWKGPQWGNLLNNDGQ